MVSLADQDPRPVIRGSTCNATLDWVRLTGPEDARTHVESFLQSMHSDRVTGAPEPSEHGRGFFGYDSGRYWGEGRDGTKLCWGGNGQTIMVEVPGAELSRFDLDEQIEALDQLHTAGMEKATRLDLALDYHADPGTVQTFLDDAERACEAGCLVVPHGFDPRAPKTRELEQKGKTLYLGSRSSESFVRIYDKGQETGEKGPGEWVRVEAEFKNAKAQAVRDQLLDSTAQDSARVLQGIVLGAMEFRSQPAGDFAGSLAAGSEDPATDHAAWLRELRSGVDLVKIRAIRKRSTFEGWKANFLRTNGKKIAELAYITGMTPAQVVAQVVDDLKPKKPTRITEVHREGRLVLRS